MTLHIGIVACSAEGAALCYRIICSEGAKLLGPHAHPEISMHSPPLNQYVDFLDRDDLRGVAALMLGSANKLAQMGADFLICPDNTIHQAMSFVTPESPLPWLHIAEVTAAEAAARGYRRLGLTGTRWLVESDVYPKKPSEHGLEHLRPNANEVKEIDLIIMEELVPGTIKPEAVSYFRKVFERMKEAKCDAVILGCTEIPLVMNEANSPLPILDSTHLLARAALHKAVQGEGSAPKASQSAVRA